MEKDVLVGNHGSSRNKFVPTGMQLVDVVIHHRGQFIDFPHRAYVGGEKMITDMVKPDSISFGELCKTMSDLGCMVGDKLYYSLTGADSLVGLNVILGDNDTKDVYDSARIDWEVHIYLKHVIDTCSLSLGQPESLQFSYEDLVGDGDDWWYNNMREIEQVLTQKTQESNVGNGDDTNVVGTKDGENVDETNVVGTEGGDNVVYHDESDEDDDLADVDPMTDDEEYIRNRKKAAEVRKKKRQSMCQY